MHEINWNKLGLLPAVIWMACTLNAAAQQKPPAYQKKEHWDVLYLKNGSVIKGTLISRDAGTVRLENRLQDTLVYPAADVDRITRVPRPLKVSREGFYNISEAGIQFSGDKGLLLRTIVGYRFAWLWQAGAGIGLDDYTMRSVPVFADFRYDFSRKDLTPFVYAGAGISIPWPSAEQLPGSHRAEKKIPGLYVHAGLGYKIRLPGSHAIHFAVGYSLANMKTRDPIRDWRTGEPLGTYTTNNYSYNRVTISAGFAF